MRPAVIAQTDASSNRPSWLTPERARHGSDLNVTGVPMLVGTWRAKRLLKFELWVLLNAGLVLASVPAAVVSSTDVKRWLTFVPFAILAAMCGVQWMLKSNIGSARRW